ncbi:MAG: hypothetical protein JWQ40_5097 [Segetibacter sp.]|jgi:hypothetical protein|nr:hypothetical protein [Segetibacter sp.]
MPRGQRNRMIIFGYWSALTVFLKSFVINERWQLNGDTLSCKEPDNLIDLDALLHTIISRSLYSSILQLKVFMIDFPSTANLLHFSITQLTGGLSPGFAEEAKGLKAINAATKKR